MPPPPPQDGTVAAPVVSEEKNSSHTVDGENGGIGRPVAVMTSTTTPPVVGLPPPTAVVGESAGLVEVEEVVKVNLEINFGPGGGLLGLYGGRSAFRRGEGVVRETEEAFFVLGERVVDGRGRSSVVVRDGVGADGGGDVRVPLVRQVWRR